MVNFAPKIMNCVYMKRKMKPVQWCMDIYDRATGNFLMTVYYTTPYKPEDYRRLLMLNDANPRVSFTYRAVNISICTGARLKFPRLDDDDLPF